MNTGVFVCLVLDDSPAAKGETRTDAEAQQKLHNLQLLWLG